MAKSMGQTYRLSQNATTAKQQLLSSSVSSLTSSGVSEDCLLQLLPGFTERKLIGYLLESIQNHTSYKICLLEAAKMDGRDVSVLVSGTFWY